MPNFIQIEEGRGQNGQKIIDLTWNDPYQKAVQIAPFMDQ